MLILVVLPNPDPSSVFSAQERLFSYFKTTIPGFPAGRNFGSSFILATNQLAVGAWDLLVVQSLL